MAAFWFIMAVVLIGITAVTWSFLLLGLNPVVGVHNSYVAQGHVGVQSHNLAVWAIGFLLGLPGIVIIGIWIAGMIHAVEVANGGG